MEKPDRDRIKKNKTIVESFNNAIHGVFYAIKSERNMKIHITSAICILILSLFYNLSRIEFVVVCITVALVLICELFNTAIEVLVDLVTEEYHPKAKAAKDIAAGAVFMSALASLVVGYFIFFDRVSTDLDLVINRLENSPVHITLISLIVTVILVLGLKYIFKKGTPFSGGMPSGHSAVAFSITTAIALWVRNADVTFLCLIISLLLMQSRYEGKIHNIIELLAGAVIGFLTTLLIFQVFSSI